MTAIQILDRPIAFHRCLVRVTKSVAAALMLSQAIYWSNRTKDPDGWFWKTAEDCLNPNPQPVVRSHTGSPLMRSSSRYRRAGGIER
jgi:hypothetical protein